LRCDRTDRRRLDERPGRPRLSLEGDHVRGVVAAGDDDRKPGAPLFGGEAADIRNQIMVAARPVAGEIGKNTRGRKLSEHVGVDGGHQRASRRREALLGVIPAVLDDKERGQRSEQQNRYCCRRYNPS
jgi:hypothetical protein